MLRRAAVQHVRHLHAGQRALADPQAHALRKRGAIERPGYAEAAQQGRQRQVAGAVHPGGQLGGERTPAHVLHGLRDVGFGDRPALAHGPQAAHHVVERAVAFAAKRQVECQRHQRALGVVADGGVRGVLVGSVVLDPAVETRLRHALQQPPRRGEHAACRARHELQVARRVDQLVAHQEQVVVVRREAFEEPQQLGVVLLRVVVARELGRAQPLHVPGVEVLVADQAEHVRITIARLGPGARVGAARGHVAPRRDQRGAGAVLQAAVAVFDEVVQEHVALERRAGCARRTATPRLRPVPERDLRFANALGINEQAFAVEVGQRVRNDVLVRHAAHREVAAPEAAQLDRVVGQLVVVRAAVGAAPCSIDLQCRHGGCDLPAGRQRLQLHAVRRGLAALDTQAHAGAVEEAPARVEKGSAHRGVERIHAVAHDQRTAPAAARQPGRLVDLLKRQRARVLRGADAREVARELAHQVAAGDPDRQAQALLWRGLCDGERDAEVMGVRFGGGDAVQDHGRGACCGERELRVATGRAADGLCTRGRCCRRFRRPDNCVPCVAGHVFSVHLAAL